MKDFLRTLCLLSLVVVVGANGQSTNGNIQGTVVDPQGAAVSGATVTARNMDTGVTAVGETTGAGVFSLPNLPPGRYAVTVEFSGMKKYTQEGVTVTTNSTIGLDVQMQVGSVSENVTVTADAAQLETETSDLGATVQNTLVDNLPLEVSGTIRNPVQFITLIPGFVGSVGNDPGSNSTDDFKVSGGQMGGTDILVDGVSISLVSPNTQWNKGVSTEGVQEFKVLQSNFSPEFGESGDGIVNLSMKSGTNDFHASAYDFLRNRSLDARSWNLNTQNSYNARNGKPLNPKPVDTQNDFGFTVGGPVYLPHLYNGRNKTFFFFDYEGFRFRTGSSSTESWIPESFRNGDFSALLPGTQLYDPTTHNPIPGNILSNDPNYTASAVMTKVFALLPPTSGSLTNNVFDRSTSTTQANLWDLKIDQNISDKQRFSFGFDWDNTKTGGSSILAPFVGSQTPQDTRYVRFSHNYILSPTVVNQFLVGFSRRFRTEASNGLGQNWPQQLGLTGVANTTFPCIKFIGTDYQDRLNNCGDSQFADNVYQVNDSVSIVRGKHNLKFGGGLRALQFNTRRFTQASGEFHFNAAETSASDGTGGYAVASALFGLVNEGTLNYGHTLGIRYKDFSFYGQDAYKLTPRLTLTYGLRYDLDLPARESQDRFSQVDPTLPNPGADGTPGAYIYYGSGPGRNGKTRLQDTYKKAFGPRVGFAYSINDKTVLRGGYGIFYQPLKEGSFADQDALGFFNIENLSVGSGAPFQIDTGFPHIQPPSGPLTPEGQNGNGGVLLVPRNSGRPGDTQSWNLDVQRQITKNLQVSVAYVGSKGTHLPALNIIPNQTNSSQLAYFATFAGDLTKKVICLTPAGSTLPTKDQCPAAIAAGVKLPYASFPLTNPIDQIFRPFPQYGDFNQEDNSFTPDRSGNSTYHAMQAQVNKRFAEGLSFLVSYTVSKNITDADSSGPGVQGFIGANAWIGQNSYNRRLEKSVSELDTPQRLVASFFYELPVGRGKRVLNSAGWANRIVSGWSVSGVLSYQSGLPTAVYSPCSGTAGDVLFAGCHFTGSARVNVVPGVKQSNGRDLNPLTTPFFNADAFSAPAPLTFGNEPRTLASARAFGGRNEDITIGKTTRIAERGLIDFRAEFFNIFNRHILQQPGGPGGFATQLGSPFVPADTVGCQQAFACGFGAITSASGPRTIQFGLKIEY